MNKKMRYVWITVVVALSLGFSQFAAASDLIVVATEETREFSLDWLGFLESKEVPVRLVTPDAFSEVQMELFIVVLGSPSESKAIEEIAKDALAADELESIKTEGKMFYKPQAWNVGQKVILFLGPDQDAVKKARKSTHEKWYEMLQDWFDIDDMEGFHVY